MREVFAVAITGIPPYRSPIEQGVRCPRCSRRYVVFVGDGSQYEDRACEAAKDKATQLSAYFVDSRLVAVVNCLDCGFQFDLMPDEETELVQ